MGRKLFFQAWLAAISLSVVACSDSGGLSVTPTDGGTETDVGAEVADHTAHTDVADGIWPPQPSGISNIEGYPASARAGAEQGVIDAARRAVMNNPAASQDLGDNFRQFDGSLGDSKSDITASFLFYNYTNNTTVEASLTRVGEVVTTVYPAAEWQPPEHSEEVIEAITLGQSSLQESGFDTAGLTGTAMLAFPQISQISSSDQHYYSERILYVTFGNGDGEVPIYSALVNVSNGTVTDSGLVR
jgi:hypothetical protein